MQNRSALPYREEPIPFITVDPSTNKFVINDEALTLINSIKGNIGVIAVAGLYRTGKSYLMNRMILDRSSGFGVGPSINPCTKGLWIWGTPLTGQTPDGEPLNILVIDSEGIGALDQDSSHDNRVFSLVVLLSSCFLYNSTGSIDENAIQNLSVVVNISKNIQLKSKGSGLNDVDPEEYARYFPSFIWVLRDFALQLIDEKGTPLTPKEYLERSLAQQRGTSESVEQKNKIRKLLRTYFKERECFTMVRPLTKEENLQNLDKMDLEELRPEFSRQAIALRRHILNKMRPKAMNNKILNGGMYAELTKSYVTAINNGAVPNIENTWSLVCKTECMKVMHTAIETYENLLKEVLYNKIPLPPEELKNYHTIGKQRAIGLFKRKAIGDVIDEYLRDLTKEIKLKYFNLKLENEREFNRISNTFIVKEYTGIERKLKNNEYKSYSEFERDIKLFQSHFLENGPNGPNKRVIINEFLQKALSDGASFFVRNSKQDLDLQQGMFQDMKRKLEQEITELKGENSKEKQYLLTKVTDLEYQRSDLEVREKNLKHSITQLKEQREQNEEELRKEWLNEKNQMQRSFEDYKMKTNQTEENLREMEKRVYLNDSEQEKQKALLKQKLEHVEIMLEQASVKEKELTTEVKNLKNNHLNQLRESSIKHDSMHKELQTKVDELQLKISELENESSIKEQKFELEKKKFGELELTLQRRVDESESMLHSLQRELAEKNDVQSRRNDDFRDQTEKLLETLNEKVREQETIIHEKEELFKTTQNAYEKEKCVLTQNVEFLQQECTDTKTQLSEMKRAYEATLKCFEGVNQSNSDEENRKITELKELHQTELKKIETELEGAKKRAAQQIQSLTEKNNEIELQSKLKISELVTEVENLKERLETAVEEKQYLTKQNKLIDGKKIKMVEEVEERYTRRIKSLEEDMEERSKKSERQLRDIQDKSEESLLQLRNFYEMERERLERRIIEEKEKSDKRLNTIIEDYEVKAKEELALHEEELENIKEELQELEMKSVNATQQYESELTLKQQTIDSLEAYVKETKENLSNIHSSNASTLEHHLTNFTSERTQLNSKIELLNLEIAKKDQEIFGLSQAKEQTEANLHRREALMESNIKELLEEKNSLQNALETTQKRLQDGSSRSLEEKVESSKELALTKQKVEFLLRSSEEIQKQNEELTKTYEDKLRVQKEELNHKFQEELEQISQEKTRMLADSEKLKKSFNNSDSVYQDKISQLDTEKASLLEKYNALDEKMKDSMRKLTSENQSYQDQINQLKDKSSTERRNLTESLQKYKSLSQEFEHKFNEVNAQYEKDQTLWKGKFQFIEAQKEEARTNLMDTQKKFEQTLQQIQIRRSSETQNNEASYNSKLATLEKRQQAQIQEINENHSREVQDLQDKLEKLEKEIKSINEQSVLKNHSTIGNQTYMEKKVNEMYENEKRLQIELENLKNDRDSKIIDYQKQLDQERTNLKTKVFEFEQRTRDLETKKNTITFEHEKERARWHLEKSHFSNKTNELQESADTLEKKKDSLLRENEKLKAELRKLKKGMNNTGGLIMLSKGHSTAAKIKDISQGSPTSMDNNLSDITNITNKTKSYFDGKYTGQMSMQTGSTSDDEGQY